MKVTVYGAGYVGLVTATCLAELGNDVLCIDIKAEKVASLNQGTVPFFEKDLEQLLLKNLNNGRLQFSTDLSFGVEFSQLQLICVGTPANKNGSADVESIFYLLEVIAAEADGYQLIVTKSTVPVGTGHRMIGYYQQLLNQRNVHFDFDIASNPEFLRQGNAVYDFMHPERMIVGTESERVITILQKLYQSLYDDEHPLITMDIFSAELTKYTANAMLATRISFMNEIALLAEHFGADINKVREGIGKDSRIGPQFLSPGCGYGGSCFPKDVKALIYSAKQAGISPKLLTAVEEVNIKQKRILFDKINAYFNYDLKDRRFAIWGLAFKPGTDDLREASSCVVMEKLWDAGAQVQAYDPIAIDNAKRVFGDRKDLRFCNDTISCLKGADALVILTEWEVFKRPDFKAIKSLLKHPVIFDGRNIYQESELKNLGIEYFGIGVGQKLESEKA